MQVQRGSKISSARPKISIGVPVFNGESFIAEALDSLLAQTFTDFEIAISDNASTDQTESICRQYAQQDPRIKYHRLSENLGAVENFNRVVHLTEGEYFKWAAIDDLLLPSYLEKAVEILERHPEVVWCHSQSQKINGAGKYLTTADPISEGLVHTRQVELPRKDHDSNIPHRRYRGVVLGTSWCADCYGLIRREALLKTQLFTQCYGAEKILMAELAILGQYREIPETLFLQRVHETSSASLQTEEEQLAFALGNQKKKLRSNRVAIFQSHLAAVKKSSLSPRAKMQCYLVLARYLLQFRKWKHVFGSQLKQRPVKGHKG